MDTNDLLKLAGKQLMIRVNGGGREKKKPVDRQKDSTFWFGALPFLIKCAMKKKERGGRTG